MNIQTGRKVVKAGFALYLLAQLVIRLTSCVLNMFIDYWWDYFNTFYMIIRLMDWCLVIALGGAALGFAIMWISEKGLSDLFAGVGAAVSALIYLLTCLDQTPYDGVGMILFVALSLVFYIPLVWKAWQVNKALAVVLGFAFLYLIFGNQISRGMQDFLWNIGLDFLVRFLYVGMELFGVACAALPFLAVTLEERSA